MTALHLRRIDPARNMCRFYRLDVQPDLFGGVLLVKEWGRIGAQGRMVAEPYESEDLAAVALKRQAERKRRRGYMSSVDGTRARLVFPEAAPRPRDERNHPQS
jgi:predicted DNA-binding WGR domain protein